VLLCIALVRVLDVFAFSGHVWASDALLGGLFSIGGLFLLSRRPRASGGART
jgi:hypothetical protein